MAFEKGFLNQIIMLFLHGLNRILRALRMKIKQMLPFIIDSIVPLIGESTLEEKSHFPVVLCALLKLML